MGLILIFSLCLLAIALIDLKFMVIPTILIYPAAILGLVCAAISPSAELVVSLADSALGFLVGWGALKSVAIAYKAARGHEGLGEGDPPLLGLIGIFLGWRAIPTVILVSAITGIVSVGLLMLANKSPYRDWRFKAIPFGPFLVLAAFFHLFLKLQN